MEDDSDVETSLARLRQFLAPHKLAQQPNLDEEATPSENKQFQDSKPIADLNTVGVDGDVETTDDFSGPNSTLSEGCADGSINRPILKSEEENTQTAPKRDDQINAGDESSRDLEDLHSTIGPPAATVSTVSPVSVFSNEYNRVKYLLRCSLPGYIVHDDMVMWDMRNSALRTQYESRSAGLLQLDSWVEVEQLSSAMGNGPNESTAKFISGDIFIDPRSTQNRRKQLVLCKVAVGRSLVVDSEEEAKIMELPSGYHSFYLKRGVQTNSNEHGFRHEYLIRDALRVLPLYLIRFSFSATELKASHLCALCETQQATVICKVCDAELCNACDCEVHSANKLVERHKRAPIRVLGSVCSEKTRRRSSASSLPGDYVEQNPSQTNTQILTEQEVDAFVIKHVDSIASDFHTVCQHHEGKMIEFYCPTCVVLVCVNCKMVGDHSIGEKGSHRLLSIVDAYESSLRESFKTDTLVDSRKSVIESKLSLISQWKADIQRNRDHVEAAIQQQYEQALATLAQEMKNKTRVLDGEALELWRQLQVIDWLDDRLDEQRGTCSIVEFLSTWNQHKMLRAEQRDFPTSPIVSVGDEQIKPDLRLVGNLQVVAGDHILPRLSFQGSEFGDQSEADHCGPLSPRDSISGLCSPSGSVRRPSENDIRRRLLSMRSVEKEALDRSVSPSKTFSGIGTLSPQGRKMMEEIRNDFFARRTACSSSGSVSPSIASPGRASTALARPRASLRAFSIQPTRLPIASSPAAAPQKQRSGLAAWTALLRHELAAFKDTQPELAE